eukprot:CAMPEP_0175983116 /NCGR_PEP_ID=MMETSP0108-20121206/48276_1 /TAXON_ID=195067 ORGANISM="Goniomonas pacifica, Strain CCMP1869" /NCGR_SAMPLE_ID=MMETSP0108 /ASSEMBLY_ACC=CAM_ASM_000204 /LENGTH=31 /DNA_ID= /DNA_START= /DNA_END= /DNA_ORIENTATION=
MIYKIKLNEVVTTIPTIGFKGDCKLQRGELH